MFLLISAVGLSLTAQLAVALPTVFGWMVSALPSLAFFALSKLVFTATRHAPADATRPAIPAEVAVARPGQPAESSAPLNPPTLVAAHSTDPAARALFRHRHRHADARRRHTDPGHRTQLADHPGHRRTDRHHTDRAPASPVPVEPARIMPSVAVSYRLGHHRADSWGKAPREAHHDAHGTVITPGQLAVRMRIDTRHRRSALDRHHRHAIGTAIPSQRHHLWM